MSGFFNPQDTLKQLRVKDDAKIVDFGCGSGGWVLPLAKGSEDRIIYAIDILKEPLSALKARAELEKISNIKTILADCEEKIELIDESCDLVLITNLLFEVDDKKFVLMEAKRILKKGGKILIVDWNKNSVLGPKQGKISPEQVKEIAQDLKLQVQKEFSAGTYHYGLLLVK